MLKFKIVIKDKLISINFMKIDKKAREEQDMNKSKLKYVESKKQV